MSGNSEMFYLQNVSAGYVGNALLFWRKGGCGYTTDIDDSEQFTAAQVKDIKRGSRGSHRWKRWPVRKIEKAARRVVDMQELAQ